VITKVLEFSFGLSKRKFARDYAQFILVDDVINLQLLFLSNLLRWNLELPSQQQVFIFVQVAACLTILLIDSRLLQLPSLHVLVAPYQFALIGDVLTPNVQLILFRAIVNGVVLIVIGINVLAPSSSVLLAHVDFTLLFLDAHALH